MKLSDRDSFVQDFRKSGGGGKPPVKLLILSVRMLKFCTSKPLSPSSSNSVYFLNASWSEVDRACGFYEILAHTSLFFRRKSRVKPTSEKQRLKLQKVGQKVLNWEMDGSSSALPSIFFGILTMAFNFWVHSTTCWDFFIITLLCNFDLIFECVVSRCWDFTCSLNLMPISSEISSKSTHPTPILGKAFHSCRQIWVALR